MSTPDVVLLSVQSPHVERILDGSKTVELRRRPLKLDPGTVVLLYAARVRRELVGAFVSATIDRGTPDELWQRHRSASGLTRGEHDRYFKGAAVGYALSLVGVRDLSTPIPLDELRRRWPRFTAPQTHRRVSSDELACLLNGERALLLPEGTPCR